MLITLALLQVAAAAPDTLLSRASGRLSVAEPARPAGDSRWRIADDGDNDPTAKDRAIRETGAKCSVVGAKVCTGRPRTLLTAEILND